MFRKLGISTMQFRFLIALSVTLCGIAGLLAWQGVSTDELHGAKQNPVGPTSLLEPQNEIVTAGVEAATDRQGDCLIALDGSAPRSLYVVGSSSLIAPDCRIHSNSTSSLGVDLDDGSSIQVKATYSGGAFNRTIEGDRFDLTGNHVPVVDPLLHRLPPSTPNCDHNDLILKNRTHSLQPGVYCGGIVSLSTEHIILEPGVYTIKDGPLVIGGRAKLVGENVSFFLQGQNSVFGFGVSTTLALSAPTQGALAGILFFEDRGTPVNREFIIRSHDAGMLEGVIYLPRGRLIVDAQSQLGQKSKWTAIVAHQVEISNGAVLKINFDHEGSAVPMPDSLKTPKSMEFASVK